jgi:bifunctional enzyme CysN/CysC
MGSAVGATAPNRSATSSYPEKDLLRLATIGAVDDGKSTLIGRLLVDSNAVLQDQLDAVRRASGRRGDDEIDLALLNDGLRAERERSMTIDVAYKYFAMPKRTFIIADSPGHKQYTRNMITGASAADLAVILIDARNGVLPETKLHGFIGSLLGIPHVVVAVNKMDLVDYSEEAFSRIVEEYTEFSSRLDIHDITFIPVSALRGDNVVRKSENMGWYDGATVLHHLQNVTIVADRNLVDFRFPVQYVVRSDSGPSAIAGTIISGTIRVGEEIVALPSMHRSRIASIRAGTGQLEEAFESQAIALTLENEIEISRGEMIVRPHNLPKINNRLEAVLCWMDETVTLSATTHYYLQHGTRLVRAYVNELLYRFNVSALHREKAKTLRLNEIGRVEITTAQPLFFDAYHDNRANGGFILIDPEDNRTVAGGMIRSDSRSYVDVERGLSRAAGVPLVSPNVGWEQGTVTREAREVRNGHAGMVIWFTGLSGSGKSTIARLAEQRLFSEGLQVVRLDGDNVRHGLCGDLGFSEEDRTENIRRVAEVARLFFDAGHIVLCSFISPYAKDREYARRLLPEGRFLEVFLQCDIEECKRRDPKGLYKRAERGEIKHMTGLDAPYEEPDDAEIVLDTAHADPASSLTELMERIERMRHEL